jgi:hypothetical protein
MKKLTREELLRKAGRWSLGAALAYVTGLLAFRSFKSGKLCTAYEKCATCVSKVNCSLKSGTGRARWKAK